jgi:hypothetical protein
MMNIATLALLSTFSVGLRKVAAGKLGRALPSVLLKFVVVIGCGCAPDVGSHVIIENKDMTTIQFIDLDIILISSFGFQSSFAILNYPTDSASYNQKVWKEEEGRRTLS